MRATPSNVFLHRDHPQEKRSKKSAPDLSCKTFNSPLDRRKLDATACRPVAVVDKAAECEHFGGENVIIAGLNYNNREIEK